VTTFTKDFDDDDDDDDDYNHDILVLRDTL